MLGPSRRFRPGLMGTGRRRADAVVRVIVSAALVAIAAAGCATDSASGGTPTSAPPVGPRTAAAAPSGLAGQLRLPDDVGPLTKAADQSFAQKILDAVKGLSNSTHLQAVSYEDRSDRSRTVLLFGGTGEVPPGNPEEQVELLLKSLTPGNAGIDTLTTVDSGAVGGVSRCAKVLIANGPYNCAWGKGNMALLVSFQSYPPEAARALLPTILAATAS